MKRCTYLKSALRLSLSACNLLNMQTSVRWLQHVMQSKISFLLKTRIRSIISDSWCFFWTACCQSLCEIPTRRCSKATTNRFLTSNKLPCLVPCSLGFILRAEDEFPFATKWVADRNDSLGKISVFEVMCVDESFKCFWFASIFLWFDFRKSSLHMQNVAKRLNFRSLSTFNFRYLLAKGVNEHNQRILNQLNDQLMKEMGILFSYLWRSLFWASIVSKVLQQPITCEFIWRHPFETRPAVKVSAAFVRMFWFFCSWKETMKVIQIFKAQLAVSSPENQSSEPPSLKIWPIKWATSLQSSETGRIWSLKGFDVADKLLLSRFHFQSGRSPQLAWLWQPFIFDWKLR